MMNKEDSLLHDISFKAGKFQEQNLLRYYCKDDKLFKKWNDKALKGLKEAIEAYENWKGGES